MSRQMRWVGGGCCMAALLCSLSVSQAAPPDRSPSAAATAASNKFGFDLYARIKVSQGNLIFSPVSASIPLVMAWAGARGGTRQEMARALHLDTNEERRASVSFGNLLDELKKRNGQTGLALQVADRLWGQQGLAFDPAFLRLLRVRYKSPLEGVDFAGHADEARVTINKWAAIQTHDRVRDILHAGDVDEDTRLVLTNAVYFKGEWDVRFQKGATTNRPFATTAGKVDAMIMHHEGSFRYARDRDVQLVELPYRGGVSMLVVLPDAAEGLDAVEARLAHSYQGWMKALDDKPIDLELPRWKVTSRLSLADALTAIGMRTAFTKGANFQGMSRERLFIHRVLQQAFVEVDEEGTEAAAVTAVVMGSISDVLPSSKPIAFHADHPFMYLLRDTKTGVILFIGRVVNPSSL